MSGLTLFHLVLTSGLSISNFLVFNIIPQFHATSLERVALLHCIRKLANHV
jgi:hypothetical protein